VFADGQVYCKVRWVSSFAISRRLGCFLPTLPEERGPAEALAGRSAETDRVHEGIFEGFRLAEAGRVGPRCTEAVSLWLFDIREFEPTGDLEIRACGRRNYN